MKWILGLFILLGCGKTSDPRESFVTFNFKNNVSTTSTPGRFVLFAHDQDRLEKARVLTEGNNAPIIFPNGPWRFSVLGFEDATAGSSVWNFSSNPYCGATNFETLSGVPRSIPIEVNRSNCSKVGVQEVSISIDDDAPSMALEYGYKWVMPQGNRDQDDDGTYSGDGFSTSCISVTYNTINVIANTTTPKKIPYFLILKIYADTSCATYLGQMEFDGDVTVNPDVEIRTDVSRTPNIIEIKSGGTTLHTHTVN
jgi:hypothetical protein